jgi:NAD(P)-dependent dehydrogenase (short-subunit alcohol dehydrogenase family)
VAQNIEQAGGMALVVLGDLSTDKGARRVVQKSLKELGGVDILINNAGSFQHRSWRELSPTQWSKTYNANLVSMVRMIRGIVPQMKLLGWGRIIQISSRAASRPLPAMPDYAASKAAILNLTVSLAKELAETGISVNSVSAGIIVTPKVEKALRRVATNRGWGADWSNIEKRVLQEWRYDQATRLGRVEDLANVVTFLASPLSDYINGANIRVDGGGTGTVN